MRTESERMAFVKECLEIEKKGGDVQEYIRVNWPSYTPRATWYNLQREYTNRKSYQLTEGIPEKRKETDMSKQEETVLALIECVNKPDDIRSCLTRMGYGNVSAALLNAKRWARKHRPDLADVLEQVTLRKPSAKATETKTGGEWQAKVGEMVIIGSSNEDEKVAPSPTCCQPARPSGVTVPDEDDVCDQENKVYPAGDHEQITFKPTRIQSRLGSWATSFIEKTFTFAPDNQKGGFISMTIEGWLNLAAEIPEAIKELSK